MTDNGRNDEYGRMRPKEKPQIIVARGHYWIMEGMCSTITVYMILLVIFLIGWCLKKAGLEIGPSSLEGASLLASLSTMVFLLMMFVAGLACRLSTEEAEGKWGYFVHKTGGMVIACIVGYLLIIGGSVR